MLGALHNAFRKPLVGLAIGSLVALSGCGGGPGTRGAEEHEGAEPATQLTILAVNPNVGRAVFRLSCGSPAKGDIPSPERACAVLEQSPELVTSPRRFVCGGGTFSWWDITISGRLAGNPLDSHTSTCWTPQMEMIGKLGIGASLEAHLLPRAREELIGGQQRTIPSGVLQPETSSCVAPAGGFSNTASQSRRKRSHPRATAARGFRPCG
jgi:hypothetical protein